MAISQPLLELRDVHSYYGNIHALKGISLTVNAGEIVTLIGSNGAGKSTTLRTISGILQPRYGQILLDGERIDRVPAHQLPKRGLLQSPEGRRIFPRLTVRENLEMGAFTRDDKDGITEDMERVFNLFPRLRERTSQKGGTLSGGEQQMLAIGRGLMTDPELLILDEPSLGLSPLLVEEMFGLVRQLNRDGLPILLVEQNVVQSLAIAHRAFVLEHGTIAMSGPASVLLNDPGLKASYLGL